jgi:hypothetical protein
MADAVGDFGAKLTLVLKQLNQSRGRLAAAVGVHKSLVGRWAAGAVRPTDHNLALLTQFVQRSIPSFTALSWEADMAAFATLIGVATAEQPAARVPAPAPAADWICGHSFEIGARSRDQAAREGRAYAGLYRLYRQAFNNSGVFIIHNFAIRFDGEHLSFRSTDGAYDHEGPVLALRGQLFFIGESRNRMDEVFFAIVNGITGSKALRLDGLVLSVAGDRNHTPGSMIMVLDRQGDLEVGQREDDADWERQRPEILELNLSGRAGERVPSELRPVLENRVGAPRTDGSFDWILRLPTERSVSISDVDAEALPPPDRGLAPFLRPVIVSRS